MAGRSRYEAGRSRQAGEESRCAGPQRRHRAAAHPGPAAPAPGRTASGPRAGCRPFRAGSEPARRRRRRRRGSRCTRSAALRRPRWAPHPAATFQPVRTAASLKRVSWPLPAADDRATLGRPLRSRHQWGLPVGAAAGGAVLRPVGGADGHPTPIGRWGRVGGACRAPTSLPGTRCLCAGPQDPGCAPAAQGRPAGGPARPERFRSACAGGPGADGARATGRQGFSGEPGATARCRRPGHGG